MPAHPNLTIATCLPLLHLARDCHHRYLTGGGRQRCQRQGAVGARAADQARHNHSVEQGACIACAHVLHTHHATLHVCTYTSCNSACVLCGACRCATQSHQPQCGMLPASCPAGAHGQRWSLLGMRTRWRLPSSMPLAVPLYARRVHKRMHCVGRGPFDAAGISCCARAVVRCS